MRHQAIRALYPSVVTIDHLGAYDSNHEAVSFDEAAISAKAAELQAAADAVAYKNKRAAEYPPIGEQLDALFHAGVFPAEMAAEIQAVKDKYPK